MKQGQRKFGQTNFFQLCDWMKSNKAMLAEARYSLRELRDLVKEAIQLEPGDSTLAEAKAAVGLEYAPKMKGRGNKGGSGGRAGRIIAKCLRDLMVKLGEPVPEALANLVHNQALPTDEPAKVAQPAPPMVPQPQANGIPAKAIPHPSTIPVVGKR